MTPTTQYGPIVALYSFLRGPLTRVPSTRRIAPSLRRPWTQSCVSHSTGIYEWQIVMTVACDGLSPSTVRSVLILLPLKLWFTQLMQNESIYTEELLLQVYIYIFFFKKQIYTMQRSTESSYLLKHCTAVYFLVFWLHKFCLGHNFFFRP